MKLKFVKNKKTKGLSATDVIITVSVIGMLALLSMPMYSRIHADAKLKEIIAITVRINQIFKEMYIEQSDFPPESGFPGNVPSWATPTNLQSVNELLDLIERYCGYINGVVYTDGKPSRYACHYKRISPPQHYQFNIQEVSESFISVHNDVVSSNSPNNFITDIVPWTCFLPETPITLSDGSKIPIERIKMGDQVLSYDTESGSL